MVWETINLKMKNKDWDGASEEIEKVLVGNNDFSDKSLHLLVYNLTVCYINLGTLSSLSRARKIIKSNPHILSASESHEFKKEIKRLTLKAKADEKEQTEEKAAKSTDGTITDDGVIKSMKFFKADTKFSDVIGLEKAKKYLKTHIIYQMQHPEVYKNLGVDLTAGMLFYGSPGCGKTLLARAVAGEIGGRMFVVNLADIINKYAGDSEKNIKKVFDEAKANKPAIVFIDEIDGIGGKRETSDNDVGQGALMHNVINALLTALDGISKDIEGVYVIAATNRPWALDDALTRSGRISDKLYISMPTLRDRIKLYEYYTKKMPKGRMNYLKLGLESFGMSPSDIKQACQNAANVKAVDIIENNHEPQITMKDLLKATIEKRDNLGTMDWFAGAFNALKGKPKDELTQYKDLIKEIKFWYSKAPSMRSLERLVGNVI